MKTITIYTLFGFIVFLVTCQKSSPLEEASRSNESKFSASLSENTWVNVYQTKQQLLTKSTWEFKDNGEFIRTETFNYLGIKEYIEEKGIWNFEESKGILSMENSMSGEENVFKVKQVSPKELKLVSLKNEEEMSLISSLD